MALYGVLYDFVFSWFYKVPRELYEAASMDGAGKWNQFLNVTLPSLRPNDLFVTIMLVINCFKVFDLVQVMTGGEGLQRMC